MLSLLRLSLGACRDADVFLNNTHKELWMYALNKAQVVNEQGIVQANFGASLYLLTANPEYLHIIDPHVQHHFINFPAIHDAAFRIEDRVLLSLAGNLYSGEFYNKDCTPNSITKWLNDTEIALALTAIWLRTKVLDVTSLLKEHKKKHSTVK